MDEFMEKAWVKAIQGEPAFVGVVCIKYLVMHMSSRRGTSLKEPIMKMIGFLSWSGIRTRRTIYSCWVLPELNLNKEFPRFHGQPIGNLAKTMPLNTTLNKHIHQCARHYGVCLGRGPCTATTTPGSSPL